MDPRFEMGLGRFQNINTMCYLIIETTETWATLGGLPLNAGELSQMLKAPGGCTATEPWLRMSITSGGVSLVLQSSIRIQA